MPFRLVCASLRFSLLFSFQALCIPVFVWGTPPSKAALALFVPASVVLYLLFVMQGYPLGILAVVLAGYAAAPMATVLYSLAGEPSAWKEAWTRLVSCFRKYIFGVFTLAAVMLPLAWYPFLHHRTAESIYGFSILLPLILAACGTIPPAALDRENRLSAVSYRHGPYARRSGRFLAGRLDAIRSELHTRSAGKLCRA